MVAAHSRCGIPLTQQVSPPLTWKLSPLTRKLFSYPEAIPPYLAVLVLVCHSVLAWWGSSPCLFESSRLNL